MKRTNSFLIILIIALTMIILTGCNAKNNTPKNTEQSVVNVIHVYTGDNIIPIDFDASVKQYDINITKSDENVLNKICFFCISKGTCGFFIKNNDDEELISITSISDGIYLYKSKALELKTDTTIIIKAYPTDNQMVEYTFNFNL